MLPTSPHDATRPARRRGPRRALSPFALRRLYDEHVEHLRVVGDDPLDHPQIRRVAAAVGHGASWRIGAPELGAPSDSPSTATSVKCVTRRNDVSVIEAAVLRVCGPSNRSEVGSAPREGGVSSSGRPSVGPRIPRTGIRFHAVQVIIGAPFRGHLRTNLRASGASAWRSRREGFRHARHRSRAPRSTPRRRGEEARFRRLLA